MKKTPNIYLRDERGQLLIRQWNPLCLWVRDGEGRATRKWDGTACMVRGGILYKRYDAKWAKGTKEYKAPPFGWEPCQDPDPITGHWPGWLSVGDEPESKWHRAAWLSAGAALLDGTYELCGPKFGANPEKFEHDTFVPHGGQEVPMIPSGSFDDTVRTTLTAYEIEGIVFHHPDGRMAKIRRPDFGLSWPVK